MTIHAAKGLEFPVIFVGGLEEPFFQMQWPSIPGNWKKKDVCFMWPLPAPKQALAYYANTRYRFGNLTQNEPSRFIDDYQMKDWINLLPRQYAQ